MRKWSDSDSQLLLQLGAMAEGIRVPWTASRDELEITSNKKLLGAPGTATRSKDATRGSWPYY